MRWSVRVKGIALFVLVCLSCVVWYAAWREDRGGLLTVSIFSVGQGYAIFIDAPSGRQVLIDGGPDGSVLRRLGEVMPPWDRSLDVVIASSADQGAVSGLVDVLQRYSVGTIVQTGVENSTPVWNLFEQEAAASRAKILTARRGQVIDLGGGAYIQILSPDRSAPHVTSAEGCVVARLVYGKTSFLFSCRAPVGVQNYLAMLDGVKLKSDVLITPGNASPIFFGYVSAMYTASSTTAFVSDGKMVTRK